MDEILVVTTKIQQECPELYQLLGETPLFLSYQKKEISTNNLEQYLASLKNQLYIFNTAKGESI